MIERQLMIQFTQLIQLPQLIACDSLNEQGRYIVVGGTMIAFTHVDDFFKNRRGKDRKQCRRRCKNCMKFNSTENELEHICRGKNSRENNACEHFDNYDDAINM